MRKILKTDTNIQRDSHANVFMIAVILWVAVFIGFLIFYAVVHPLYIFDTDDWTYIVPQRRAIPVWKGWNPTKVLPETFMALVAELGVRFFMPLNGDYIGSMAIAFALVLSAFYSTYFVLFYYLSTKKFGLSPYWSLMSGIFMILVHFLPFIPLRHLAASTGNAYMYAAPDITSVFNYTIPALLHASLILLFSSRDYIEKTNVGQILGKPKLRHGILLLVLYLAINSNMFQNIMLIAYISSVLLVEYIKGGVKAFFDVCRKNVMWIGVIIVWLLSLLMESQGGRAGRAPSGNYLSAVGETVKEAVNAVRGLNLLFVFMFAAIEGFALIIFLYSRKERTDIDKEYARLTIVYSISLLITLVYLVLVCAKVGTGYFSRSDVFSGILFFAMVLVWISLIYITKKSKAVMLLMPIVIYVLLFETVFNGASYRETNYPNHRAAVVEQIDNDILEQVLLADSEGKTAMELYVPVYDSHDNFPIASTYGGDRISFTLFSYGLISKRIEITIIPIYEMNEKYNLQ